jgi:hypothetical protein
MLEKETSYKHSPNQYTLKSLSNPTSTRAYKNEEVLDLSAVSHPSMIKNLDILEGISDHEVTYATQGDYIFPF